MRYHQATYDEPLVIELSRRGRKGFSLPHAGVDVPEMRTGLKRSSTPDLPEISEVEVVRHYTRLSEMNYGVDNGIYPLGSCTMKYNPKVNEEIASMDGFTAIHPDMPDEAVQGALRIIHETQEMLKEIAGVDEVTLQPAAGAHAEFLGMRLVRAYFDHLGEERTEVIVPDTAHGTNPASASMAGYHVIEIKSNPEGMVDIDALSSALSEKTAAFMLTNPNTLGIFEKDVLEIARMVHEVGAILYYDGANLNAIMGRVRPGDMGFDIVHFNLHKTFSTPHGGGGPGNGGIGVKSKLAPFLPVPVVRRREDGTYYRDYNVEHTIGKIHGYMGNFGVIVKAWAYLKVMGKDLRKASEIAVLNANYLKHLVMSSAEGEGNYTLPFAELRKHEFVLSAEDIKKSTGAAAKDIVKRLIDRGMHPPTVYFPLIVHEALMIEPTETESVENLREYATALLMARDEAKRESEFVKNAPYNTPVGRVNDTLAVKKPVLTWKMMHDEKKD